jgi:putative endonuclease
MRLIKLQVFINPIRDIYMFDISMFKSTLERDASASFFCLGRILALGSQDCTSSYPTSFFHLIFLIMYTVYVLYSRVVDTCYVGYTSDLPSRLLSHNELGTSNWTKRYRPWELIYKEEYSTKRAAMQREKELKSGVGREFIRKNILKDI